MISAAGTKITFDTFFVVFVLLLVFCEVSLMVLHAELLFQVLVYFPVRK